MKDDIVRLYDLLDYTNDQRDGWLDAFIISDALTPLDEEGRSLTVEDTKRLLRERLAQLQSEYDRQFTAVQALMPKIVGLWDELEIDDTKDPHCQRLWCQLLGKEMARDSKACDDFLRHVREPCMYPEATIVMV